MLASMTSMSTFLKACSQELEIQPSSPAPTRRFSLSDETAPVLMRRSTTAPELTRVQSPSRRSSLGEYFSVQLSSSPTSLEMMEGQPRRASMGEYFSWLVTSQSSVSKRDMNVFAPTST